MLDGILDYQQEIRSRPVWQPAPSGLRTRFMDDEPPPEGEPLERLYRRFMEQILPYAAGNVHPGFMGWVHGGGTPVGMVAEMLAAGLNANCGGRNQIPLLVERQVIRWMRRRFGLPEQAGGILTSGTSAATIIAIHTARCASIPERPVVYASRECHGCIGRALALTGIGREALCRVAVNDRYQIDLDRLRTAITADRRRGRHPWLVVGNAGTVNSGAIDDLQGLAEIARREGLWLHVDAALGGAIAFSRRLAARLRGIERADSLAMDFHKWLQVPYDAGLALLRSESLLTEAFATDDAYLLREEDGLAAGFPWPCDQGFELSRPFRALKIWFTLSAFGPERLGAMIEHCCALADLLAKRIDEEPWLERTAPVALNIVCFRPRGADDRTTRAVVRHIHRSGLAAPSLTLLDGRATIRAAIVNHRTGPDEIDRLIEATRKAVADCRKGGDSWSIPHNDR
ncbi:MAG: aminotransferase class V-fold PLP-dependent enzyme [Zetaproteobacteria bacterium]|nr:MAG: aminotransferase class V-fold PLP-dependent enzyme [Zetaproteobacteria bacterium]